MGINNQIRIIEQFEPIPIDCGYTFQRAKLTLKANQILYKIRYLIGFISNCKQIIFVGFLL